MQSTHFNAILIRPENHFFPIMETSVCFGHLWRNIVAKVRSKEPWEVQSYAKILIRKPSDWHRFPMPTNQVAWLYFSWFRGLPVVVYLVLLSSLTPTSLCAEVYVVDLAYLAAQIQIGIYVPVIILHEYRINPGGGSWAQVENRVGCLASMMMHSSSSLCAELVLTKCWQWWCLILRLMFWNHKLLIFFLIVSFSRSWMSSEDPRTQLCRPSSAL